jgi:hypothetical protein
VFAALMLVAFVTSCSRPVEGTPAAEGPDNPLTPSIEGTVWAGTDSEGRDYVFRFKPRARLAFSTPSGSYDEDGDTWSQQGVSVTMSMTWGYATYRGAIDGDTMSGSASNIVGRHWRWSVHRMRAGA